MQSAFNITPIMRSTLVLSDNKQNGSIEPAYKDAISKKYAKQCNYLNRPIGNARALGAIESIAYYKAI